MTKLSESIVGKIRQERIAPVPKWHFLLKGYVFWTIFAVSVFLGSLSFSVVAHIVSAGDFDVLKHLQGNLITSAVMFLPYVWLFSLIIFAMLAYFNWKCTKLGYRYKRRWVVLGSVGLSIFLGSIFYALGLARSIDTLMAKSVPFYDESKHNARMELWLQPDKGLLVGKIVEVNDVDDSVVIKDDLGNNWSVTEKDVQPENQTNIKKGRVVKVIGKKDGEHEFSAKEIRRCDDCDDDEEDEDEDDDESDD